MFDKLLEINRRPAPFECYTADALWTDPHTSEQMLAFHLNPDIDVSSRNHAFIDRSVDWIAERFAIPGKQVADFGCGPGLYAARLAKKRASVTGIDFSERSIRYARKAAQADRLSIDYVHQNYLEYDTDRRFDLILMIMCDFCALGPDRRARLLEKFRNLLAPGGAVLLDVYSLAAFERREESAFYEKNQLSGFWSTAPYYAFVNTFTYEPEKVVLDKYTIVEQSRTRIVYNWLQYFSADSLRAEFRACGLAVPELLGNVAGDGFDPEADEFAVVALKAGGKPF